MKNTIIIVVVIIAVILAGAIFGLKGCRKAAKAVDTDKVRLRTIKSTVIAFGRVEAKSDVNISAEVSEKIESLYVDEGDTVNVGDTLVVLNSDRYIAMLNRARAQVHQVEANLKRARENLRKMKELYESGAVSQDQLINAQTEVDVLEAQLESAQAALSEARDNLAHTVITSPINGIITSIKAKKGEFVVVGTMNNPGTVLLTIADLSQMEAELGVDETEIVKVKEGQKAIVKVDALPEEEFEGVVTEVGNSIIQSLQASSQEAKEFKVVVLLKKTDPRLKPGLTATADIIVAKKKNVIAVPIAALVVRKVGEGKKPKEVEGVFVYKDGKAEFRPVKKGIMGEMEIEIVEGLKEGEEVIVGPFKVLRNLQDGDPVEKKEGKKSKG